MELNLMIRAAAIMMPSIKNVQQKLIMSNSKHSKGQGDSRISTNNHFDGYGLIKVDQPDDVFAIHITTSSNIKGIKGKANINIRGFVTLHLDKYDVLKEMPTHECLNKFIDLLYVDLAQMQNALLHQTNLRIKKPSAAYSKLLSNYKSGVSEIIIPNLDKFASQVSELTELEHNTLEASSQICLSFIHDLSLIFSDLYWI